MTNTLGKRISELRKKRNMTQSDLAKSLKMSTSSIAMWETGKRDPDTDKIKSIADLFSVSVDYLLGRAELIEDQNNNDSPEMIKAWLRSDNELSPEEQEQLSDELEDYFKTRKERILKARNKGE